MATFDELAKRFDGLRATYSSESRQHKRNYLRVWHVGTGAVWLTLLLAIVGLSLPFFESFYHPNWLNYELLERVLLFGFLPALGCLSAICTTLQFFYRYASKWTAYRSATESLNRICSLYGASQAPFDGEDADERLAATLDKIQERVEGGDHYRNWRTIISELRQWPQAAKSLPHEGLAPRGSVTKESYRTGRLQHQRQYLIRNARWCAFFYILFQLAIFSIAIANPVSILMFGRKFWFIAIITVFSLGILNWRDFLQHESHMYRYLETSTQLRLLDEHGDKLSDEELVQLTEQALEAEFEYWYLRRGGIRLVDGAAKE